MELRWRRAGVEPQAPAVRGAIRPDAAHRAGACGPVCRAALPLELLVPRWGVAPRGAGDRGRSSWAGDVGDHRSRWLLRRGPLRRGGQGGWSAHGVRHRDHAVGGGCGVGDRHSRRPIRGRHASSGRHGHGARLPCARPVRHPPARARRWPDRICPAVPGTEYRASRRREGGATVRVRRRRRHRRRTRLGTHWLPERGGPCGAGRRRTGGGAPGAAPPGRRVRARSGAGGTVGPR